MTHFVHFLSLSHILYWLIPVLLFLAVYFRHGLARILRTMIGAFAFFIGSKARYTFKIFWFIKPRFVEIDSFEELQNKTERQLIRSHLHDFLDNIESGDLFIFVGHINKPYQVAIKWFTASPVSHVGVCHIKDGKRYFVEAASSGFKVSDLHKTLHSYFEKFPVVVYRKLYTTRNDVFYSRIDQFIDQYKDRNYTPMNSIKGLSELVKSALDFRLPFAKQDIFHNSRDVNTLFCSELVAELYGFLDLLVLDEEVPSNEYTPADFSRINEDYTWGVERQRLSELNADSYLGDEIYVNIRVGSQEHIDLGKDILHKPEPDKNEIIEDIFD